MSWLNRNRYILLIDIILIIVAAPLAFLIRLDASPLFVKYLPVIAVFGAGGLVIKPFLYWAFGLYRHYWRYASVQELKLIVVAVTTCTLLLTVLFLAILLPYDVIPAFPRSVLIIDWLLQLIFVGGVRFLVRVSAEGAGAGRALDPRTREKRILIAGAGDAGTMMAREIQHNPGLNMVPVGYVDDDVNKIGKRIHNISVLGTVRDIPDLVKKWYVQEVVIAMPTAPGTVIREIALICEQANVPSRIMPGVYELLNGAISVSELRTVQIEDLLRREPVETDSTEMTNMLAGTRVLVTGAGGSIGAELCRQILRCQPAELVMLGHGENPVFDVGNELAMAVAQQQDRAGEGDSPHSPPRIHATIGDVRFPDRIRHIFEEYRPQVVFHAAAHKHVPLMELNPTEAITNNVSGTRNLLDLSLETGVRHFVLISTDKAVNPTSIMGASKRVAEFLVHQAAKASDRPYMVVRFGNVLGSRGSVVPIFKEQIAKGGPVTVTHPEMVRYFMTIPEAVQLVLQSAALGQGGEVFLLDMGEPVKIVDLARDLIRLSGLEEGRDMDIVFSGTRPGEKLFEELFVPGEVYERTCHEKIFIAGNASSFVPTRLSEQVDALEVAARRDDRAGIVRMLQDLIPEYQPSADSGGEAPTLNSPTAPFAQSALDNGGNG